jgi:hypothetical protein
MDYETIDLNDPNKQFTWMEGAPLSSLLDPKERDRVLLAGIRETPSKPDGKLMSVFSGRSATKSEACLMCQK